MLKAKNVSITTEEAVGEEMDVDSHIQSKMIKEYILNAEMAKGVDILPMVYAAFSMLESVFRIQSLRNIPNNQLLKKKEVSFVDFQKIVHEYQIVLSFIQNRIFPDL